MQELFLEGVFLGAFVYALNNTNVQASGCPLPNFVDSDKSPSFWYVLSLNVPFDLW